MEISIGNTKDKLPGSQGGRSARANAAPKPRATPAATDAQTLKQALATLDSLYSVTTVGLMMVQLPETAGLWAEKVEELSKTNEDYLKASPRLAAAIAKAGSVGGAGAFLVAHAMALATVMASARGELAARKPRTEGNVTEIRPGMLDNDGE